MWDDGNNTNRDQAAELKELRIKYIKIVSRCRKLERQLQDNNNTIDSLREENETLRLTPLLVKGGGNVARPQSRSQRPQVWVCKLQCEIKIT